MRAADHHIGLNKQDGAPISPELARFTLPRVAAAPDPGSRRPRPAARLRYQSPGDYPGERGAGLGGGTAYAGRRPGLSVLASPSGLGSGA